jgi:hypothetical protein
LFFCDVFFLAPFAEVLLLYYFFPKLFLSPYEAFYEGVAALFFPRIFVSAFRRLLKRLRRLIFFPEFLSAPFGAF